MVIRARKLSENIFSMITLKGLEYILNFLLIPYLIRTLGIERFGAISLMQGVIQYFIILTNYGFNMTGPRSIANCENNKSLAYYFSSIMAAKVLIACFTTFIFIGITYIYGFTKNVFDYYLFWAIYLSVIGNIIFPIWFFQGIQQMRYITIINVISKCLIVILIVFFVKSPNDYLIAAVFQSLSTVIAGIMSFYIILKKYRFLITVVSFIDIKSELRDGWHIFLSTVAINLYTTTNIIILGILTNNVIVGYFSSAFKIIDSIKGIMGAIMQAIYPYSTRLFKDDYNKAKLFLKKSMVLYCCFWGVSSFILVIFSDSIIRILFGIGHDNTSKILQLIGFLPFIISFSNIFGIQVMLSNGWNKAFSIILLVAATFDLMLIIPFVYYYQAIGVSIVMILTEVLVTFLTGIYTYRKIGSRGDIFEKN